MARGEINSVLGMTEGRFRTMIKSALRPCWRNSSRKTFIQSVRQRGINPDTGRERFVLVCVDCGKEMGMSEKERRTKIDGTLEKRAKSVYEIDHVDGITPFTDVQTLETLTPHFRDMIYGKQEVVCVACHKFRTANQRKKSKLVNK